VKVRGLGLDENNEHCLVCFVDGTAVVAVADVEKEMRWTSEQ
jgi:hypothetical protein